MILDVSRGHIKVKIIDRVVTVQGEMFFPGNDKLGFVVYSDTIKFWGILPIMSRRFRLKRSN